MASAQNRFLNQTVASASKTQTPNKLQQSVSTSQFTKLAQTSNSSLDFHSHHNLNNAATTVAALIPNTQQHSSVSNDFVAVGNQQQSSLKSGGTASSLTQSQANLRTNMFSKTGASGAGVNQQPGYQPSYLREPAHKNSSYASVSPMKHQARLQQSTSSVKKYGQHFSTSKRQGKLGSDSKGALGGVGAQRNHLNHASATVESKLRSGSQYVAAKKLYSGAGGATASTSTSRGGHAAQAHSRLNNRAGVGQEEYQGSSVAEQHQTQRSQAQHQQPVVENSFTRLHQGNSSVVRTFERKQLLQQSTSQVRKSQQPLSGGNDHHHQSTANYSRFQQSKFRNSNAPNSNSKAAGQNQLFQTKDRANTSSQLNMAQPYLSNNSGNGSSNANMARPTTTTHQQQHQNNNQQQTVLGAGATTTSANPMDSDRTADSGKCDTARNGNNRYKGQTKQPRQSKSSSTKQSQIGGSNQLRQQMSGTEPDRQGGLIVPHQTTSSSALAIHHNSSSTAHQQLTTPSMTAAQSRGENTRLAASQSMTQVPFSNNSQPSNEAGHNLPNSSGLETSLSFTRRLIEETAARNERMQAQQDDGMCGTQQQQLQIGQERDISKVAVSIQSNLITSVSEDIEDQQQKNTLMGGKKLEITTSSQENASAKPTILQKQQFISPKNKAGGLVSGIKTGQNSVISPINQRVAGGHHHQAGGITAITTGNEKKVRGTSNNKVSNFTKTPTTLQAAFSPDKRPNVSRSQIQNNLFLKRGAKGQQQQQANNPEKSNTRENNRMHHQRMFAGQSSLNQPPQNSTPGNSVSPSTKAGGPLQVTKPSYMQSTFTRSTKMNKNVGGSNVHTYQLNRVRPQKKFESTNTTQENIPAPDAATTGKDKNTSSQKDLAAQTAVKILDQQTAPASLTQSQGPPKIGDSSNKSQLGRGSQSNTNVYSKPNIGAGGAQSAAKKTKSNTQSYQWPHHQGSGGQSSFYPGQNVKEGNSNKSRTAGGATSIQQPLSSTNKQSRNLRPASKRNSTNQDLKKAATIVNQQNLSSGKSPLAMAVNKHHQSSTTSANKITGGSSQTSEWQRRHSSLIISDQFAKGVIEQPIGKVINSAIDDYQPNAIGNSNSNKQQRANKGEEHSHGTRNSSKTKIYGNSLASQSELINQSSHHNSDKITPKHDSSTGHKGGKQQPKKSLSSLTESSSVHTASDVNPAHSYKQKQEQIIEMIQSNMKRSEDIQQSLTAGSKFFQSVSTQQPAVIHDFTSSYEKKPFDVATSVDHQVEARVGGHKAEEGDEVVHLPGLKAPTPSKASSALKSSFTGVGGILHENQPDVPLFQPSSSLKTMMKKQASSGSWKEQHTAEVVEDVFNDAQLLQKRIASEENTPVMDQRISELPVIQPAQQPGSGSSSENGGGTFGQEEILSPINIMGTIMQEQMQIQKQSSANQEADRVFQADQAQKNTLIEPKSAFAMALANKKANGEDFVPTLINQQPFDQQQSDDEEHQSQEVMQVDELEVVTEDVAQEDRYSIVYTSSSKCPGVDSSSNLNSAKRNSISSLPMSREDFINQYRTVLTEQEMQELEDLDLTNGMVYYANDILTRTSPSNAVTNYDDAEGYYVLQPRDHILYRFEVIKVLGKGSFAQVVSAIDHLNGTKVAVKINRNTVDDHKFATQEAKLLKFLMSEDPSDDNNVVRMFQHIPFFRQHQCFVFELLNTDLFAHIEENEFQGFHEQKIRLLAAQLLKALIFLEKRKVIHCDLKPENILCVDQERSQIKVADFGSGCLVKEQVYTYVQSRYYRAPEVILRIRYSEKVDIWSLGCILAELYTGQPLFPGNSEQEQLEYIMQLCGVFPEAMIDRSKKEKREYYFDTDYSPFLIEDSELGILRIPESRMIEEAVPSNDHLFLDFIAQCLVLDPEDRPGAAVLSNHPWIREFFGGQAIDSTHDQHRQLQQQKYGHQHQIAFNSDLPQTSDTGYIPLRQPKKVQSFQNSNQHLHESLHELSGNMLFLDNDNNPAMQHHHIHNQDYFDGQISDSLHAMTETGGFGGDGGGSDGDETVKFGHSIVSRSRQREEAGARASAAEISPDRPIGSLLLDRQRMTSFISSSYQNSFGSFNIQPLSTSILQQQQQQQQSSLQSSAKKASPLKPSNESLLEHYKYEKQSRGGGVSGTNSSSATASNFQEQLLQSAKKQHQQHQQLSAQQSSASKQNKNNNLSAAAPANVEEPKIISMTTSGFAQQQKQ